MPMQGSWTVLVRGWQRRLAGLIGPAVAALALVCLVTVSTGVDADRRRVPRRVQVGYATWYGRAFHGQETASGRIFNRHQLVAAHRSLPFDTIVRVINLENRRRVTVRIIDRGPYGKNYAEGTIIDLSTAAARRLDMIEDGQVPVRVEVVKLGGAD